MEQSQAPAIFPPFLPVSPMVLMPDAFATATAYITFSEFPEVLIANYDMEERRKSLPMQMNLFEMFDEQKTSVWHGSSRKEDEDGSVSGDNRSAE